MANKNPRRVTPRKSVNNPSKNPANKAAKFDSHAVKTYEAINRSQKRAGQPEKSYPGMRTQTLGRRKK